MDVTTPTTDSDASSDEAASDLSLGDAGTENGTKPCFYDSAVLPYLTPQQVAEGVPDEAVREEFLKVYAGAGLSATILFSPQLVMVRFKAKPGEHVPPHHHGVNEITYILQGELRYGNQVTKAGMGYYNPDRKYSWTAGPEGADFLEIFAGIPALPIHD